MPSHHVYPRLVVAMTAIALLLSLSASATAQSSQGIGIVFRAWACPDAAPASEWEDCDAVIGATYRVEAEGVETAESPVTTVRDTGIGSGVLIQVPNGTTSITVTQVSGAPDGYAPAPGFDPFTAEIADLPQVGFGGESMGPGITFINIPVAVTVDDGGDANDGGATDDSTSGTTTLPETGTGDGAPDARDRALPAALLMLAATLFGAGVATRRLRAS